MILLISLLFAFLFFLLLFLGLQVLLRRKREMAERIQMFSGYQPSVVRRASVLKSSEAVFMRFCREGQTDGHRSGPKEAGSDDGPGGAPSFGV